MSRRLLLDWAPGETRAALLEDDEIVIFRVERDIGGSIVGTRFIGRVTRVAAALEAAFVDIGLEIAGFLPLRGGQAKRLTEGEIVAVEVVRDARAAKGPELRRLSDQPLDGLTPPMRIGAVTTAAERLVASFEAAEIDEIIANDVATALHLKRAFTRDCIVEPVADLFERHEIREAFDSALSRVVTLPEGGEIVIEQTEACTIVDVNMAGQSVAKGKGDQAILAVNMAAAREVARQLRWRDIGGVVVIDFISMRNPLHRRKIEANLASFAARDPSPISLLGWTRGGHFEMTRRRRRASLSEIMLQSPTPEPTARSTALSAIRAITFAAAGPGPLILKICPHAVQDLDGALRTALQLAAQRCGRRIEIVATPDQPPGTFNLEGR